MNEFNRQVGVQPAMDLGLRSFLLGTYRYMGMAMAVTALVAYFFGQFAQTSPALLGLLYNPFTSLAMVIGIVVGFGAIGRKLPGMTVNGVRMFLFGFAAVMGIFMSAITLFVAPAIILKILFMTVAIFAGLSLFGYSTQRNLATYAKYAFIAFAAFVGISLLGMFFPAIAVTGTAGIVITAIAGIAISVIIAWETQYLKQLYYAYAGDTIMKEKLSAFGAASLLLSFINLFNILLSLFGGGD